VSRRDRADEEARALRRVAARAARRLAILEWVVFLLAALLATGAGALVALLVAGPAGLPFRATWMVASLLLFVVPAAGSYRRLKRGERKRRCEVPPIKRESDG